MSSQLIISFSRSSSNFLNLLTAVTEMHEKQITITKTFRPFHSTNTHLYTTESHSGHTSSISSNALQPCSVRSCETALPVPHVKFIRLIWWDCAKQMFGKLSSHISSAFRLLQKSISNYDTNEFNEIDSPWICCWRKLIMQYRGKGVARG